MAEAANKQVVTKDVLIEVLSEALAAHEAQLLKKVEVMIDEKIKASEARQLIAIEKLIDEKIAASEKRMEAMMDRKIAASEKRILDVVGETFQNFISDFDQRLDRLEQYYGKRLDEHAVQIDRLRANFATA